jgi:hypothetical protein
MKKIIFVFIAAMLVNWPAGAFGQKAGSADPVLKIFDKYEEREGVESVSISPAVLGMMKNSKNNDKKTQDLISKISGLRILTLTDEVDGKIREGLVSDLQVVIKKDFEEIMRVKNSNERVELYVKKDADSNDFKSALLFVTSSDSSVTVMHLAGKIDKNLIEAVINGDIGTSSK